MNEEVLEQSLRLKNEQVPFAIATVIEVRGSASARPGAKALISAEGRNLAGWVGGGCAEAFVCDQAMESLAEQRPRIVTADLDDEVFGLGMPCGGVMDIYIEPFLPAQEFSADGSAPFRASVDWFARQIGLRATLAGRALSDGKSAVHCVEFEDFGLMSTAARALIALAAALAKSRGQSFLPISVVKNPDRRPSVRGRLGVSSPCLWVTGRGRITEELARFATQVRWPVTIVSNSAEADLYPQGTKILRETSSMIERPGPSDFVVIASHHKGDPLWIERSLAAGSPYVGLIASQHRCALIRQDLMSRGLNKNDWEKVSAPAGLEMDCRGPAEIALSLIVEMLVLNAPRRKDESIANFG